MKPFLFQILLISVLMACAQPDEKLSTLDSRVTVCPQLPVTDPDWPPALTLCTTDTCLQYQAVWKELFMERNNISEAFFDAHIILNNSMMMEWNGGISFYIKYSVTLAWAVAPASDQFIMWINPEYQFGGTPKGVALNKSQINAFLDSRVLASEMHTLSTDALIFGSQESALDEMTLKADVNLLCNPTFTVDRVTGHIILKAYGTFVNQDNKCISAALDLTSGESTITEDLCSIS